MKPHGSGDEATLVVAVMVEAIVGGKLMVSSGGVFVAAASGCGGLWQCVCLVDELVVEKRQKADLVMMDAAVADTACTRVVTTADAKVHSLLYDESGSVSSGCEARWCVRCNHLK